MQWLSLLTAIYSGSECTKRPQSPWPAFPEAPTYSFCPWARSPISALPEAFNPYTSYLVELLVSALSTSGHGPCWSGCWPADLLPSLTSELSHHHAFAWSRFDNLDSGLTTSAASVPALLLSSEAVDGPAAAPASLVSPLSSLCLRRELAHAVPWHILCSVVFTEVSWKNLGNSHLATKQSLPQLKQALVKTNPETTHYWVNVKLLA